MATTLEFLLRVRFCVSFWHRVHLVPFGCRAVPQTQPTLAPGRAHPPVPPAPLKFGLTLKNTKSCKWLKFLGPARAQIKILKMLFY